MIGKLLGVLDIPEGTDLEISFAIYEVIDNLELTNSIQTFVFDTAASNTKKLNGAWSFLVRKKERDILVFAVVIII